MSKVRRLRQHAAERQNKGLARERLVNDEPKLLEAFTPGSVAHQGDLIIVGLSSLPASARPRANRQLAEGDTQGSRHVLKRGEIFDADPIEVSKLIHAITGTIVEAEYIGPVFISPADPTAADLDHPEHGSQGFPPGTICAVVYQRNLDHEERESRVRD